MVNMFVMYVARVSLFTRNSSLWTYEGILNVISSAVWVWDCGSNVVYVWVWVISDSAYWTSHSACFASVSHRPLYRRPCMATRRKIRWQIEFLGSSQAMDVIPLLHGWRWHRHGCDKENYEKNNASSSYYCRLWNAALFSHSQSAA